jgi:hypothetical protein
MLVKCFAQQNRFKAGELLDRVPFLGSPTSPCPHLDRVVVTPPKALHEANKTI